MWKLGHVRLESYQKRVWARRFVWWLNSCVSSASFSGDASIHQKDSVSSFLPVIFFGSNVLDSDAE